MAENDDSQRTLLEHAAQRGKLPGSALAPLADRMRPRTLDEVVGQPHLVGRGQFLRRVIENDRLPSLIFWGPPGVGKTTLAQVVARTTRRRFVSFSAVLGGVAELRSIVQEAAKERKFRGLSTILFVDEIHRFNRAQQDAFLPHVESGTVTLIGATTENPSFAVNAAVLSRAKVLRLQSLEEPELVRLLESALIDEERGVRLAIRGEPPRVSPEALALIARSSRGDARRALSMLEAAVAAAEAPSPTRDSPEEQRPAITVESLQELGSDETLLYDKSGEEHYNVVSAFIKSMRGSDPDAAVYWLIRMLDAGEDPLFILRRLMIFASEDVGNADPRALTVAVAADQSFRRMGMPEGYYPIAHACLYLASCPKSGAVGRAWKRAQQAVKQHGALPVPHKLRNAVTQLMKEEGYGAGYRSAHDDRAGFVPGETYLPERLVGTRFYEPTPFGLEKAIGDRLARIRAETGDGPPPEPEY